MFIMKFLTITILLFFQLPAFSQDEIITKDNETKQVRVVSEENKSVNFYFLNDPDKTIHRMEKKNIKKIKYDTPLSVMDAIVITDDSLNGEDLFSHVVSYLIESGYEMNTFDMEHSTVSVFTQANFRLSVEIDGNRALFSGFIPEKKDPSIPSQSERNVIRLVPRDEKKPGDVKYPGEERIDATDGTFKEMDRICRNYLMNNKGSLIYIKE
jgi:hypothetical protein